MYFDSECVASTLSIDDDFFQGGTSGGVQCYNSSNIATNLNNTAGTYQNVCSGWSASNPVNATTGNLCGSDNGTELNLWNAVLGGTDLSPNSAGTELQTVNPTTSSFQPPTLVAAQGVGLVNTDFNLTNGVLTLADYSPATAPVSQPTITNFMDNGAGCGDGPLQYQPLNVSYDAGTGTLTATQYQQGCPGGWFDEQTIPNGPISLNMNTCAANSAVQFNINYSFYYPPGMPPVTSVASASFSCVTSVSSVPVNTTLDYNLCVNDPNATGGVLAINLGSESSPNAALACACIPEYLGGATPSSGTTGYYQAGGTSSGILLGATSSSPSQQCATQTGGS
jgi:hypothetical protein